MTRTWTAEQIAAVAARMWVLDWGNYGNNNLPDEKIVQCAAELLDACADEAERRAKLAAEEAGKR